MRLYVHTPKSSLVMPSYIPPVICSPFITMYDLDCVCHTVRYVTSVAAAHSTLCRMHSHTDTREHCLLRVTVNAIMKHHS